MLEENSENETPENNEGTDQPNGQDESDGQDELVKTKEAYENQKVRAEKAEREAKRLEAELAKTNKPKEKETPKNESNEPEYGKLAFLESKGVSNPDDQKVVQEEAARLNLPLTDILGMEHIQSKLKKAKVQREAEDGMPDGSGTGTGTTKNTVEYWMDKKDKDGGYENPKDPELAIKVINARMEKERRKREFPEE